MLTESDFADILNVISDLMENIPESCIKIIAAYIEYNALFIKLSNKQTLCLYFSDEEIMNYVNIVPELVNATVTKLIIDKENKYFELNYTNVYFNCNKYIKFNFNNIETHEINNSRK
jgi:hypothetical protein